MSSIAKCENDIRRYQVLKSNVKAIATKLELSVRYSDNLRRTIKPKYQINDDYTPIVTRINYLNNNINSTQTNLENTVIPAIDQAISELKKEIARLEEEERIRREQERIERERLEALNRVGGA